MKTKITFAMLLLITMATPLTLSAQAPTTWELTQQFTGIWVGAADIDLGGQVFQVTYNLNFQQVVDGNAMTMDEWFDDPTLGNFRGANLIGLNANDGMIHWFSADNLGTAHEHIGSWVNPRHFFMVHQSLAGGQTYREEIHFRLRGNNTRMVVELVATLDGAVVETVSGTLYLQQSGNRTVASADAHAGDWVVFPNPARDRIHIESKSTIDELVVVNDAGQEVYRGVPGSNTADVELNQPGIYFITAQRGPVSETRKVVVEGD